MSRNTVTVGQGMLRVEPRGLDKLWSFTREIVVPLAHVRGATHDPGVTKDPKGVRAPGLGLPRKWAGTWRLEGERHFWNISGAADVVVVELADEEFTRLHLSVDNPREVVDTINAALT